VEGTTPTKANSIAIGNDGHDYSYVTRVSFGSQSQPMWMLIDTGAANTWVMGADCMSDSCAQHDTFDDEASTTFTAVDDEWDVTYGSGEVTGSSAKDNVTLGELEVFMEFGIATEASDDFLSYPMDGILGLGRTGDNDQGTPIIMQALSDAGLIDANILGINLPRIADGVNDGQITFGDVDTEKFTGDIVYTNTASGYDLWLIPVDDAGVDGTAAGFTNKQAIVDTGSSFILLPKADMDQIHSMIPGAQPVDDEFVVPCSTTAPLQFTFSGATFDVSTVDYIAASDGSSDMCSSNIKELPDYYGPDMWLLGDVFLKNVYSVFDFDQARIGFALPAGDNPSSTSDGSFSTNDVASTTSASTGAPQSTGAAATISSPPQLVLAVSIMTAIFSSVQFMGLF
jgi:cathepsin D